MSGKPENLKPWKPGQSGNPGGRPRRQPLSDELKRLLEQEAPNAEGQSWASVIAEALLKKARQGDVRAFAVLANRIEGKPHQSLAVDVNANVSLAQRFAAARQRITERQDSESDFNIEAILWHPRLSPHKELPPDGSLRSALWRWTSEFHAEQDWFVDDSIRTLRGWYVAPDWRSQLKCNPIGNVTSIVAMGERFKFDCEGWEMQTLTWARYSQSVRERFEQKLADYEAEGRRLAESRGLVRAPHKYSPQNLDWFVLYQFAGLSSKRIADRYQCRLRWSVCTPASQLRTSEAVRCRLPKKALNALPSGSDEIWTHLECALCAVDMRDPDAVLPTAMFVFVREMMRIPWSASLREDPDRVADLLEQLWAYHRDGELFWNAWERYDTELQNDPRGLFVRVWINMRCPPGADPLLSAEFSAKKTPMTLCFDAPMLDNPDYRRLLSICYHLQKLMGIVPVALPQDRLALMIGKSQQTVSGYLSRAERSGILKKVSRHNFSANLATKFLVATDLFTPVL